MEFVEDDSDAEGMTGDTYRRGGNRMTFSEKLYEVALDGQLIRWTADGNGVVVDEHEFENNVMNLYPGFVQTPSFRNLKRLFRDYNFSSRILRRRRPLGWKIEFRNPFFTREERDNILQIRPKERLHLQQAKSVRYRRKLNPGLGSSRQNINLFHHHKFSFPAYRKRSTHLAKSDAKHPSIDLGSSPRFMNNILLFDDMSGLCRESSGPLLLRKVGRSKKNEKEINKIYSSSHVTTRRKSGSFNLNFNPNATVESLPPLPVHSTPVDSNKADAFELLQIVASKELAEEDYANLIIQRNGNEQEAEADISVKSLDDLVNRISCRLRPDLSPFHYHRNFYELSFTEL